jgi:hypothetical protein
VPGFDGFIRSVPTFKSTLARMGKAGYFVASIRPVEESANAS